jgi:ribosomal protein L12E/L44/L45/RPP1/RPP2
MYGNSLTKKRLSMPGIKTTSKMKKVIATVAAFMLVVGVTTTVNAQGDKKKEEKKEKKEEKKGEKKEKKEEAKPKN